MDFLDKNEWPLSAHSIAKICRVSRRTAERWLSGKSEPPYSAIRLIQLHQRERIMPDTWPSHFRFCNDGSLDVGHKIRLHDAMLEHHAWSVQCWYALVRLTKEITDRMDDIEKLLPSAQVIEIDNYRNRLKLLTSRPFSLGSGYEAPIDKNVIRFINYL